MDERQALAAFAALGQEHRLRVVRALVTAGPDGLAAGVLTILERLHAFYGDPRYRPSPWLKRRAMLGVSLLTPEA